MSIENPVPIQERLTLTLPEAAWLAGLPVRELRHAADRHDLETFTLTSTTKRVRRRDLEDWLNTL
ncbi:excisionase [Bifidobacterium sp. SO1]|uniref:excisionase n=1 Tax=Bifidobacterium sp. SO1 TaxID=2809029 RepID=UPI001BDDAA45|nr:excisionase [Bifidobacterium sp. SO1]MBT1161676.1 DNA-binding protein [Bifidobacterium sp. SO1]